jgi:hypothetical protein
MPYLHSQLNTVAALVVLEFFSTRRPPSNLWRNMVMSLWDSLEIALPCDAHGWKIETLRTQIRSSIWLNGSAPGHLGRRPLSGCCSAIRPAGLIVHNEETAIIEQRHFADNCRRDFRVKTQGAGCDH